MDDTQITSPATDDAKEVVDNEARPPTVADQAADGAGPSPDATVADDTPARVGQDTAGAVQAAEEMDRPADGTGTPGFRERGRMRRRARFLRRARELAYRDLGGLVFDLHRFGQRNDTLVLAKLDTIGRIDSEVRTLESALEERQPVTVLREAGVAACPRCAAIHGSDDRFCPHCGLAMDLRAERPVAGQAAPASSAPASPPATPSPAAAPSPTPSTSSSSPTSTPSSSHALTPSPSPPASAPSPPPIRAPSPSPAVSRPAPSPPSAPPTTAQPAGPAPHAPPTTQPAEPAPHAPPTTQPAGPAPHAPPTTQPAGPAPQVDQPTLDQPTEIIRPAQR